MNTSRRFLACHSACLLSGLAMVLAASGLAGAQQRALRLNDLEYFEKPGVNVMVYQDIYPEGHQGGICIIQNGQRVASNGDVRLSPTPGQWQPVPQQDKRVVNRPGNEITVTLSYPDPSRNRKGFNPIEYPDLNLSYQVHVTPQGDGFRVVVDLDTPLPAEFVGKVGFNLELYPALLFGKSWYMDDKSGIFPRQANGPTRRDAAGETQAAPLATGHRLSVAPDADAQRLTIESQTGDLQLLDGRVQHNNGWFVVRSLVAAGATKGAVDWTMTPHGAPGWTYQPVIHVSQVGYHPQMKKMAVIELDPADTASGVLHVKRVAPDGGLEDVLSGTPTRWGRFLRYQYLQFDFTQVKKPGMYVLEYRNSRTQPFQISADVFKRNVWQPTLEYFLPIQMCHMRVEEQYRTWHGACHLDDARMAPVGLNHFDGYVQGPSTLNKYQPSETVPNLNAGGWHDAGDDDLRIESQADEVFVLASAYEAFGIDYDDTSVDQANRVARIHQPDGKPDILQQVEHGILTILGGYQSMGRLYRGVITPTLSQYVMLGDTTNVTDGLFYDASLRAGEKTGTHSGKADDRWVFTEQDSPHEYKGIAALAIAGRVMKDYNPALARQCVDAAEALWRQERDPKRGFSERIEAAVELWLATRNAEYGQTLLDNRREIVAQIDATGWAIGRALPLVDDRSFVDDVRSAVAQSLARTAEREKDTPFGVPYTPRIWGAGWDIQRFGVRQYFLHQAFPDLVSPQYMLNAMNFVLGVHPGENTASFASGVGARSMTVAYGFNRADWTYIPGGVVSGTALIRPDLPELKDFPYLWQQTEYVMGGGATHFMFLVMAADHLFNR